MPTHKKGQDKDKYYHLAKDQGYRSRAAFKLIQINKRFDFLSKARVCVDLCAAPGGWCQVAAKFMPPGSIVLGIDLMPIKTIRNVKTVVSDITTAECRKIVTQELNGWKADVVLCDGAPNIGSAYSKDAYVQNELVLAALKTATDHLTPGGTFCTKVYRSVDYNALIWVLQQLFENVQAMKPNSSRSQSSEIFVVCLNYNAPKYIDPKLLDPNHVFKEVADPGLQKVDVLHKKFDKLNKRHRTGYDESLGMLLSSTATVSDFVESKEAVRVLSDVNKLEFSDRCQKYKDHPATTSEVCIAFSDLKLLGKIDFKKLLKWRTLMKKQFGAKAEEDDVEEEATRERGREPQTEEEIQAEIMRMREGIQKKAQKEKKKARAEASRERTRQALGITANAFGGEEDEELFDLAEAEAADATGDIDDLQLGDDDDEEEGEEFEAEAVAKDSSLIVVEEALEDELEHEYLRYVRGKKAKKERDLTDKELQNMDHNEVSTLEGRTLTAKQARKAKSSEGRLSRRDEDDQGAIRILNGKIAPDEDLDAYVKMLSAEGDGDSEEEEFFGDDDEDELEDEAVVEDARPQKKARSIVTKDILPPASRAGRWFANPIFKETVFGADGEDDAEEDHDEIEEERPAKKGKGRDMTTVAAAVLHEMPKTEKEIRKEKRKKETLRQLKKLNKNGIDDEEKRLGSFEVAPAEGDDNDYDEHLDEKTKAQRVLISQGMGKRVRDEGGVVEIVPATESGLKVHDSRSYDSDNENYDAHDKATTLALGTMMLRGSKKKALVDASYNRYSWNDPKDLPSWFMDDEMRHNKPQLPVPAALMEQIKSKFQTTGTKDIKKVAEARMRKRKRATNQLKAAKKQANSVADNSEMSDKQKIKAIARAMKSTKGQGINPSKVYVVTKKVNGASSGSKGAGTGKLKFVDSRMKKDKRATRAANKRQKKGGKGRK